MPLASLFRAAFFGCLAFLIVGPLGAAERLRVALVAGSEMPAHQAIRAMELLKRHLEQAYPMDCVLIASRDGDDSFDNLAALRTVDTALLLVRRKTPPPQELAIFREFFESGKGFVALKSTSHAFENWKSFDAEVLGVTYDGGFANHAKMDVVSAYAHPIFTGADGFETDQGMYAYKDLAPDVQIMMEGTVGEATVPMAWGRTYKGGRVFYLSPGGIELFDDPGYRRILANALLWVKRRPIPGAATAVQRSYLPEAHPGAFAITFPQGPGLCYDPVRGGINYAWDGDFADLRPRWLTKQGQPVRFVGETFYRETLRQPLRTDRGREPQVEFLGYKMLEGVPEFRLSIDGRVVREELRPLPDGTGFTRRFRVGPGAGALWFILEPQPGAVVSVTGASREGDFVRYAGGADGEFSIVVQMKGGVAR